jgi:hypothetical protein
MNAATAPDSPELAAQIDWAEVGEFDSGKFSGAARKQYEIEASRIERDWDNQPI